MNKKLNRRNFLKKSTAACIGCCALMASPGLLAQTQKEGELIDPKKRNYCAYKCPESCLWKNGSEKNDVEMKEEAYKAWKIKERFGLEFDAENMFCFGCKNPNKPDGIILKNCTVRTCVIEKGLDCCIECNELTSCEKELWDRFPSFKQSVIDLQKKYKEQQAKLA